MHSITRFKNIATNLFSVQCFWQSRNTPNCCFILWSKAIKQKNKLRSTALKIDTGRMTWISAGAQERCLCEALKSAQRCLCFSSPTSSLPLPSMQAWCKYVILWSYKPRVITMDDKKKDVNNAMPTVLDFTEDGCLETIEKLLTPMLTSVRYNICMPLYWLIHTQILEL